MKKYIPVLILASLLYGGCSPRGWMARFYVVRAESAVGKAGELKHQKVSFDNRLPYFSRACRYYAKAYEIDPTVFTFIRIEEAADVCWKSKQSEKEEMFKNFEEQYIRSHPQEYERGDAGMGMVDMGG